MLDERELWYWISTVSTIGIERTGKLIKSFESLQEVYNADFQLLEKCVGKQPAEELVASRNDTKLHKGYESLIKRGISLHLCTDESFPARLQGIPLQPYYIFSIGTLPPDSMNTLSVVGSRGCTDYGKQVAGYFSEGVAAAGVGIISGLAEGIDAEAHKGALRVGGYTLGVIGNGIGDVYPQSNWQLFDILERKGCIISEYPPGRPALKFNFPFRNRLISALSDAVLVIESRRQSGTLHTVDHGLSQGREIYAVPGKINDPMSEGCNRLLAQGARPAIDVNELLFDIWGISTKQDRAKNSLSRRRERFYKIHRDELSKQEWIVFGAVTDSPVTIDDVCQKTSLPVSTVAQALFKLTEKRYIRDLGGSYSALLCF